MPHQISAAIKRFLDGFRRFQTNYYHPENFRFEDLQHGQQPSTMVIGCADSRVDPAMLMGCEPGELFVVRNIANLVPPCEDHAHETHHSVSAALEYAVTSLEVERIIVLGHGCCGGIRALMDGITRQPEGAIWPSGCRSPNRSATMSTSTTPCAMTPPSVQLPSGSRS